MQRDVRAFLSDIEGAGQDILEFTQNVDFAQYAANKMMRGAVEREFLLIGEAIVRARQTFPEIMDKITSANAIVGFRNRLVHGYETIRDETVWEAVQKNLPVLLAEVGHLLDDLGR